MLNTADGVVRDSGHHDRVNIAKQVFHAHGADGAGRAMFSRRLTRGKLLAFFAVAPLGAILERTPRRVARHRGIIDAVEPVVLQPMCGLELAAELEEENRKLKQLVADLSLDKHILQDVLARKL